MGLEQECYRTLLAHILYQTMSDYTKAKAKLEGTAGQSVRPYEYRNSLARRLNECERFFAKPPYDYGDIDLMAVKSLCDEKAKTDTSFLFDRMAI